MVLHVPIMLVVRAARKAVDKLDEAVSVGDPDYLERCKKKHFIPKLPFVLKNGAMRMCCQGPKLSPEEEEEWRAKSAAAHAEAAAEAAAEKERKAAEKAAEKADKAAEKAAEKAEKEQHKAAKRAEKEQRRAR